MFRDKVIEEAIAQRELRSEKRPIPANLRRYARLSGLGIVLTCCAGSVVVAVLAYFFGALYWGIILFFFALAAIGFLQLVTGLHLLTRR
jgi:hypothetical protein